MAKINYYSYPLRTGYGVAAKNYIKTLEKVNGIQINHYICRYGDREILLQSKTFDDQASTHFIHMVPTEGQLFISKSAKNIISTVYEADKLTSYFAKSLEKYDEITVPCQWNVDTFKNYTNKPVHLLPHLPEFFGKTPTSPMPKLLETIDDDTFVFLNISEWVIRKNIENTILAFCKAFDKKEKVLFIFKTGTRDISKRSITNLFVDYNFFKKTEKSLQEILDKHNISGNILFINQTLSEEDMMHLYHRADCYFTMTNAEGWGMGSFESAFYAKPVIATNYGGHLDYLNDQNAYLISCKLIDFKLNPWDNKWYYKGFKTGDPDLSHAIELLRFVYENKAAASIKGKLLKEFVVENFSNQRVSNILKKIID
ncbi:MAG TPA: glycosyltransferase [Saprospiraceae bacterium]|nr:glycosyltransferase [Saprospiraceae bacterium]